MTITSVPGYLVFPVFMLLNGVSAFCCLLVIRKHWNMLDEDHLSRPRRSLSRAGVLIIMGLPLSGFVFGFVYFTVKTIISIFAHIF